MGRTCPYATRTTAYLLGTLDRQDHEEFGRHARFCIVCRREIDELTPVVQLLQAMKADKEDRRAH